MLLFEESQPVGQFGRKKRQLDRPKFDVPGPASAKVLGGSILLDKLAQERTLKQYMGDVAKAPPPSRKNAAWRN